MDFVTKSFQEDETLTGWTLQLAPKSEDKYVVKLFNWSEFHLSETTCYKIHNLVAEKVFEEEVKIEETSSAFDDEF